MSHSRIRRVALAAPAVLLAAGLLAGCQHSSPSGAADAHTWVQTNDSPPPTVNPQIPGEAGEIAPPAGPGITASPGAPQPGSGTPGGGSPGSSSPARGGDPNVVADHLAIPWGLALLPDGSALVGERDTGRIVQVQPQRAPVQVVATLAGLDTSGDGGLLGLAISPSYTEDGLVFAYITTRTDNRVVKFTLGGPPSPVLTGIPRGATDNGGRIVFGPGGDLYVGTGDAGTPALAAAPGSLAGKVLRMNVFGKPAPGNPDTGSPVYASGFHDISGICFDRRHHGYVTDVAGRGSDELDILLPGASYGWPAADGKAGIAGQRDPAATWAAATTDPGGCAVIDYGLYVGALRGKKVLAIGTSTSGAPNGKNEALLADRYGRLRTVVAAPDGALWITTSNRDGSGTPVPSDDRVLRIKPESSVSNSPL